MVSYYSEKRRYLIQIKALLEKSSPVLVKNLALLMMERYGYSENTLNKTLNLLEETGYIKIKNKEIFWIKGKK